ncbi:hypothetical protein CEXT_430541, partial [Caerostris extrusa]
MDNESILETFPEQEGNQELPTNNNKLMELALTHYNNIVNRTDSKDLKIDVKPQSSNSHKVNHKSQIVFSNSELTAILASINNTETLLVSIYCSPSKNIENNLNLLRNILIENDNRPTIILGDFNAKSRVWGQRDLDERGSKLLSFCHQLDLNIENQPDTLPSFSSSRGNSWIDLLITRNLNAEVQMEILDEVTNSDHNLLNFSCSFRNSPTPSFNKIHINALSWLSLKANLHKIISKNLNFEHLNTIDLNEFIRNLQTRIKDVASKKCIINQNPDNNNQRRKKKNAIWWTRELEIKRRHLISSIEESYKVILDFHFPWSDNNSTSTISSNEPSISTTQDFSQLTCGEVE